MHVLFLFAILLITHWVADFGLQTDWQAINKSKNNYALGSHVATYTGCLAIVSLAIFGPFSYVLVFIVLNGMAHFATDYVTSRITSHLYAKQDRHNFFLVVGLDQLIHQITLAITYWLFIPT